MAISAAEQYMLEVLNRARLDPVAEAARQGTSLNAGLPNGQFGPISGAPQQVLAVVDSLDRSATSHSQWMASTGRFSHVGENNSLWDDRMISAGYRLDSYGWRTGENLAMASGFGSGTESVINTHFRTLWNSALHRSNMMGGTDTVNGGTFNYREIGISEVARGGNDYVTLNFAYAASKTYVTGVVYEDRNGNKFYNIGEGDGGVRFRVGSAADQSEDAGGYAVAVSTGGWQRVDITGADMPGAVRVNMGQGNVKLDVVNGNQLFIAGDAQLLDGFNKARLLGRADYDLTGNAAKNALVGNKGNNVLKGAGGNDMLNGGSGNDALSGDAGRDVLFGGAGRDRLHGGDGNDILRGNGGADTFIFRAGDDRDVVRDFRAGQGDKLRLDDNLWSGGLTKVQVVNRFADVVNGDVVFDFGADELTLDGISSLRGLANAIEIF